MATTADVVTHVRTVKDAIARMESIGDMVEVDPNDPAPVHQDGLVCFNQMYTRVTKRVDDWVKTNRFADPGFMTDLDVAFANRYFGAVAAWNAGRLDDVPRVWWVLLDRRTDPGIASIQFAAAGINAHINVDLSIALVHACRKRKVPLDHGTQRADYELINDIFGDLYAALRDDFTNGRLEQLDRGRVERVLNNVSHVVVDRARDAAWFNAQLLFEQRKLGGKKLANAFTDHLDRTFGYAARGLLVRNL